MGKLRMTYATASVVQALALGYRYGFDIAAATGLRGGTVYPILRRLQDDGMAKSQWEEVGLSRESGRPARKYYRLSPAAAAFREEARQRMPLIVQNVATPEGAR
jgi:PadR family transcriptional regulator PadR